MKTTLACLVILAISSIAAQTLLYPKLPNDEITDVVKIDNEFILVNRGGCIYKSYDMGKSWQLKGQFQGVELREVIFTDELHGFIDASYSGFTPDPGLIYSTDGGESWNEFYIDLGAVAFQPVSGSVLLIATSTGNINRLDNFYNNWETVYFSPTFTDTIWGERNYSDILDFEVLESGNIIALGTNSNAYYSMQNLEPLSFILESRDNGISWDTLSTDIHGFASEIIFSDDLNGWINIGNDIYRTIDSGDRWYALSINLDKGIADLSVVDNSIAYGLKYSSSDEQLIKTTDGGISWFGISIPQTRNEQLMFLSESNGVIYGEKILVTENAGISWNKVDTSYTDMIFYLDFYSLSEGFATGRDGIYKTTDGGSSWQIYPTPTGKCSRIEMTTATTGWLKSDGKLFNTTNAGNSWIRLESDIKFDSSYYFTFYNHNFGIAGNYLTHNGGSSWQKIIPWAQERSKAFDKFLITEPNNIYASNSSGIWISNDSAKTWNDLGLNPENRILDFTFYNSNIGVAFTSGSIGFITVNGGVTWNQFTTESHILVSACRITGPSFNNSYQIIAVGSLGEMQRFQFDSDGIIEWQYHANSFTKQNLYAIDLVIVDDRQYIITGGTGFHILSYYIGKKYTDVKMNEIFPETFTLSQNFPNPFNPTTTIFYSLPDAGNVELSVYNSLGQLVNSFSEGYKSTGNHKFNFNGSNLANGVYFYTIKCSQFTETKKMLLMK